MEQDRHKVVVAEGWAAPMRPVPAESAYVPSAAGKRRTKSDSPATSRNAPIVVQT